MYQPLSNKKRVTTHDLVHARIYKIMKSKIEPLRLKYKLNLSKNMNDLKGRWLEKLEKNRKIRRSKDNKRMRKEGNAAKQKRMEWLKEHGVEPSSEAPMPSVNKKKDSSKPKSKPPPPKKSTGNDWTVEDTDHKTADTESKPLAKVEHEQNNDDANVDSFFLTNSGENYVSSFVTAKREQNQQNKHNRPMRQPPPQGQFARNDNKFSRPNNKNVKFTAKTTQNTNKRTPTQNRANTNPVTVAAADLHPSWAAKLNAKPLISEFQGKKIVFDN
jgi:hypothetical protein